MLLTSCKKEINLKTDDKSGNIVIEGNITNQPGPYYVRVTKSVALTDLNQYPAVTNATVIISDNIGQKDTLQYVSAGRYKTTHLITAPGNTYKLRVETDGKSYTAESTMPQAVVLEDLIQKSITLSGSVYYNILPVFTDPQQLGNRYLFIIHVAESKSKSYSLFTDNINNGMVNQREIPMGDLSVGNTVSVEMQCIGSNIYTYNLALNRTSGNNQQTPANPPSNISNGALGYFSAHTSITKSIVIK